MHTKAGNETNNLETGREFFIFIVILENKKQKTNMNKRDQGILATAANKLLIEVEKIKGKLKDAQAKARLAKNKSKFAEDKLNNEKEKRKEYEKIIIELWIRFGIRCKCEDPETCEELTCFYLASEVEDLLKRRNAGPNGEQHLESSDSE